MTISNVSPQSEGSGMKVMQGTILVVLTLAALVFFLPLFGIGLGLIIGSPLAWVFIVALVLAFISGAMQAAAKQSKPRNPYSMSPEQARQIVKDLAAKQKGK